MTKSCNKCHEIKPLDRFSVRKGRENPEGICKDCKNKRIRDYVIKNYNKIYARKRKYANSKKGKLNRKQYRENPENKRKRNEYCRKRWLEDPAFKLSIICRTRLRCAMIGITKGKSASLLLGCSIEEYKKYLESLWLPGMNWENYGLGEGKWNIDHILCCKLFDLTDENQQKICFNYKNTKPEWHVTNQFKCDKLETGKRARNLTKEEKKNYLISKIKAISI